jgi:hypothetical protein
MNREANFKLIDALIGLMCEHGVGPIIGGLISFCRLRGERCGEAGDTQAADALFEAELDLERALSRLERANADGPNSARSLANDNEDLQ